jgi:hypothetical protein
LNAFSRRLKPKAWNVPVKNRGRTLADVCRDPCRSEHGAELGEREGFAARYKQARELGYHDMVDHTRGLPKAHLMKLTCAPFLDGEGLERYPVA